MKHSYFLKSGMKIDWQGKQFLIRLMDTDLAVLENLKNNQKASIEPKVIFDDYAKGKVSIATMEKGITYQPLAKQEHVDQANVMLSYLRELDAEPQPRSRSTMKKVARIVSEKHNYSGKDSISDSTLYRWYDAWIKEDRNVAPLVVKPRVTRKPQFDESVLRLADDTIWQHYMKLNGPTRAEVYREYQHEHAKRCPDSRVIGKTRFYELFANLDPVEVTLAREGREAARRLKHTNKQVFVSEFLMERVEFDAVHLSIGIYDSETGEYLGSPIIYIAIEVHTRYIVGYYISYEDAESAAAVTACLKHMVQPKTTLTDTENEWKYLGLPSYVVFDAGVACRAKSVIALMAGLQIEHNTTPTASPWKKPFVERFIRRLREEFARKLPGYQERRVNGNIYDKTLRESACLTRDEFAEALEVYFVDVYHQSPHRGLGGMTPQQAVEDEIKKTIITPLNDAYEVDIRAGYETTSTLQRYDGIQKNKLKYQSDELRALYNRITGYSGKNPKITYLYDESDVSCISVIDPDSFNLISVPCTDPRVQKGLTLSDAKRGRKSSIASSSTKCSIPHQDKKTKAKAKGKSSKAHYTTETLAGKQSAQDLDQVIADSNGRIATNHNNKQVQKPKAAETTATKSTKTRKASRTTKGTK